MISVRLSTDKATVNQLAEPFDLTLQAVSNTAANEWRTALVGSASPHEVRPTCETAMHIKWLYSEYECSYN